MADREAAGDDGRSQSGLRAALVVAALAAVLILSGVFSDLVGYICLGVIAAATLWTSPQRRRDGGGWWTILGVGALLSAAGAGIAELSDSIGGILVVLGGALVVIGAIVGYPTEE